MFPTTSRYFGIETAVLKTAEGKEIAYLRRRFLPPAEKTLVIAEHIVTQDERLDNITARYLVDPEQFWRLCDANNAMRPEELTKVIGRRLIIPLPQGGQ
jgi:hypothetical protein